MSKKATIHIGTLYVKPEYTDTLIKSFDGLRQASGYISHKCFRDIDDENKLTLVEKWESKEDHQNFVNSFSKEEMEQWLNMIANTGEDSYFQEV